MSTCVHACVRSSPDYRENELEHVAQLACVRALSEINESDRIRRILRMDERNPPSRNVRYTFLLSSRLSFNRAYRPSFSSSSVSSWREVKDALAGIVARRACVSRSFG